MAHPKRFELLTPRFVDSTQVPL